MKTKNLITPARLLKNGWRIQTGIGSLHYQPASYPCRMYDCWLHARLILIDDRTNPYVWMLEICQTDTLIPNYSRGVGIPFSDMEFLNDFMQQLRKTVEYEYPKPEKGISND